VLRIGRVQYTLHIDYRPIQTRLECFIGPLCRLRLCGPSYAWRHLCVAYSNDSGELATGSSGHSVNCRCRLLKYTPSYNAVYNTDTAVYSEYSPSVGSRPCSAQ